MQTARIFLSFRLYEVALIDFLIPASVWRKMEASCSAMCILPAVAMAS